MDDDDTNLMLPENLRWWVYASTHR
jgi:hypothetical protein